jgi:hypothetical protein
VDPVTSSAPSWPPVETKPAERHPKAPEPGDALPPHYAQCFGCGDEQDAGTIAVGSRGINQLPQIVRAVVTAVKSLGGHPWIVPAMGSHGGATAAGQAAGKQALGALVPRTPNAQRP